ncbi:MAG: hypothetical protein ACXW0G_01205 [Methylosarcina sp.]
MARQNNNLIYPRIAMLAAFTVLSSGCAVPLFGEYGPIGHSREEFEHYVEEVFRFQNEMTSKVMMLLETGGEGNIERILQSEQHMHQICEPLNTYVSRDMDGLSNSFSLRRQVMKSTTDCDHAAHELKALLDEK